MVQIGDLTEPQRAALAAIVQGRLAWSPLGELKAAGHGEAIEELIGLKLVDRWGEPYVGHIPEDRVTLNPYAAWLLKVHILERTTIAGEDLSEDPYWAETSQEPRSIHLHGRRHEVRCPWMDEFEDPYGVDPNREPEFLMDAVSGEEVKLFTQLEDGRETSGIKIKIDPKLKGAKGKGGAKQKRRKAG